MITNHRAHIVMDFVRKGMRGAEPRFGKRSDNMGGLMVPLSEWESLPPDAEFIIKAVNSYDALREAAGAALKYIKTDPVLDDDGIAVVGQLTAALALVNSTDEEVK